MNSANKGPGERIEARCTRCNDITGHIIVALVGGVIVKVQCCACGSVHKYRGSGAKASGAGASGSRASGAGRAASAPHVARSGSGGRQAEAAERLWREALERPSLPDARPYTVGMPLAVNDVVEHPKYGLGVVQQLIKPDKADILFRDGLHTMRCQC